MLKTVNIEDIKVAELPKQSIPSYLFYKERVESGKKLDFKVQTTRTGKYLNVYEYDKKRWRYILVDKIEL